MARDNPSNPHTQEPNHTSKDVQMPIAKARVLDVHGMPNDNGFHTARIRVYADNAPYVAPVLAPMSGCVWVPPEGSDVAVMFDQSDKPWIIGSWYALDRVDENDVFLPDYEPGDLRLGNHSGSELTVHDGGSISIRTDDKQSIDIDNQTAIAYMSSDQTVAGDDAFDIVQYDTAESNAEGLFNPTSNTLALIHDGVYDINATCEFSTPGSQNRYIFAAFVNGSLEKEKARHSVVNQKLSLDITLDRELNAGDEVDIRVRQDSGTTHDINGSQTTNDLTLRRYGI